MYYSIIILVCKRTKSLSVIYCLYRIEELDHCLEAAHLVIDTVRVKLREIDENHKKSIKSSIALMLYLIAKLDSVHSSQHVAEDLKEIRVGMKNSALKKISTLLKNWIRCGRMGDGFGLG